MTRLAVLSTALALAGCSVPTLQCSGIDAEGVVKALQPEEQFRSMLSTIAMRTQTVAMAYTQDASGTKQKLKKAVDAAVQRHGPDWKRNLISVWSTLNAAELNQVCTALNEQDQNTFMKFTQRIGPEVQARNEPVLNRAGGEVLEAVWPSEK